MVKPTDDDLVEDLKEYTDDYEAPRLVPDIEDAVDATERLLNQQPAHDKLIHFEVQMQKGDEVMAERVTQRALDPDERTTGTYDDNSLLNSVVYEVKFPDGEVRECAANIVAENLLSQVDTDGFSTTIG